MHAFSKMFSFSLAIFLIGCLCSCNYLFKEKSNEEKQTYFVQLEWESARINQLREEIKTVISKILQEELGQAQATELFLEKKHNGLSLYYVNDMLPRGESLLLSSLDAFLKNNKISAPSKVVAVSEVAFFGEGHDELVMIVDDSTGELVALNKHIKDFLHTLNSDYKAKNGQDLFDVQKSEQFPYVPHIGLGRLRSNSIKELVKDPAQKDIVLGRIKDRTKQEVVTMIKRIMPPENAKISFNKIMVFSLQKRMAIRDYNF